ncbi:hypothetical protein NE237_006899 [Protea cynaroides]|uniref:Morc S5 domain-containing protein n=1 Tax=Protea cynaroides TaxID=273540 RepID=A0A9Q0QVX4_9MAGN|nr:hypothetical protein NE237_006899 [Protea cynaroides]
MDTVVKKEILETGELPAESFLGDFPKPLSVIELSSSDSDFGDWDDSDDDSTIDPSGKRSRVSNGNGGSFKKQKLGVVLPLGFLDPLPPEDEPLPLARVVSQSQPRPLVQSCKQFWKAGDYDGAVVNGSGSSLGGMDHVRVHPKFLHSNATSHKWALGAFAELLDNSLDELCNGATYVNVDVLKNMKDGNRMLLVEDNGGGMDPDKVRQCMSLGYSVKSKLANTIGQYGNGFKTSTMRLGADVIVFSRCNGKDGKSPTQSIGMLSYTFLTTTGKEDIVVPMLDYVKRGRDWTKITRSTPGDWNRNLDTIVQWSPYSSEADLLNQFNLMKAQGTRIIIYNLWEDDQGELELDFETDQHDIQMRGVNRDESKIEMAKQYPNSKHFLTYRHSLRSYASILYLRLPPGFRIILRGKDVEHHNIVNDMMLTQEVTYRPQLVEGVPKDTNMIAVVKIGFVKDAKEHIDIQGFNVYHKNRLIKPFWRVWNASGSDGRGAIGVLEANFIEPAHDKQGFERTTVLARLETRLKEIQKDYWSSHCHEVGYAPRRNKRLLSGSMARETSPDLPSSSRQTQSRGSPHLDSNKLHSSYKVVGRKELERSIKALDLKLLNGDTNRKEEKGTKISTKYGKQSSSPETFPTEDSSDHDMQTTPLDGVVRGSSNKASLTQKSSLAHQSSLRDGSHTTQSFPSYSENLANEGDHISSRERDRISTHSQLKAADTAFNGNGYSPSTVNGNGRSPSAFNACSLNQLKEENRTLKARLTEVDRDLQFEKDRCKSLESQVKEAEQKLELANKEQEALIDIFSEERCRRDSEEENLREKLKTTSNTVQELLDRIVSLERMRYLSVRFLLSVPLHSVPLRASEESSSHFLKLRQKGRSQSRFIIRSKLASRLLEITKRLGFKYWRASDCCEILQVNEFQRLPNNPYFVSFSHDQTMKKLSNRRIALFAFAVAFSVGIVITLLTGMQHAQQRSMDPKAMRISKQNTRFTSSPHRKLFHTETSAGVVEPSRVWGEKCSRSDIVVSQGATSPLPNGIPTYTVEIVNACTVTGCDISGIHLSCGWFSSARLINPKLFKRIRYNDCILNDGKPFPSGASLSFQYANSFPYPLAVSSVVCC